MSDKDLNDQLLTKKTEAFKTEEQNQQINLEYYKSPELIDDIHKIEQDRINKYMESHKETTTPKLSYGELEKRINEQKYDRSVFSKWKLGNSKRMKKVTSGLHNLDELLKTGVKTTKYADVENAFFVLQEACIDYLTTHSPKTAEGEARYRMVQQISDRIRTELGYIRTTSDYLTTEDKEKTWGAVLAEPRVIMVKEKQIEIPKQAERSGTATLFKINDESGSSFFKVSEHLSNADTAAGFVSEIIDGITREMIGLKDSEHPLYSGMTAEEKEQRGKELQSILDTVIKIKEYGETGIIIEDGWNIDLNAKWEWLKEKYPDLKEEEKKNYLCFMREMEKKVRLNIAGIKAGKIRRGTDLDVRNEATTIMAQALGISDMVMESQTVTLDRKGKKIKGIKMKEVGGASLMDTIAYENLSDGKKVCITPFAMKQFTNLHLFDIICGQVDRNTNNVMSESETVGKEITLKSITAIDNDLAFGMLTFQDIINKECGGFLKSPVKVVKKVKKLPTGAQKVISETRVPVLKAVDQKFAERILAMRPEEITFLLRGKISDEEIKACQDRLKGVQQLLRQIKEQDKKRKEEDKVFISSNDGWDGFVNKMIKIRDKKGMSPEEKKAANEEVSDMKSYSYFPTEFFY